jgi:hypothetical protein
VARIFHTGRRTTVWECVADALSKGNFTEVEEEMPGAVDVIHRCSREMTVRADVLVGRDYVLDMEELLRNKLLD